VRLFFIGKEVIIMKRRGSITFIVRLLMIIGVLVGLPMVASGEIPQQINFQGYLTDASGAPLDGDYQMKLSIYDEAAGSASPLWTELQTVLVINGIYNVQIGQDPTGNPFPGDLFEDQRWLGVTVGTDAEMAPRQPLTSTPFAMRAEVAETLVDGAVGTVHIANNAVNSAKVANGTLVAEDFEDQAIMNEVKNNDGSGSGLDADRLDGYSSGSFVRTLQDYGRSGVATNLYEGTSTLASKYVDETGDTMSGSTTGNMLEVNNWLDTDNGYGVYSRTYSETGAAVAGFAMNQGGRFLAYGDDGRGVYGSAPDSGTGINYGGYFTAAGARGYGVYGRASNTGGYTNYGGYFSSAGEFGHGVYARATGASGYGIWARSDNGDGLYARTYAANEHAGYFTTSVGGGLPGAAVYTRTTNAAGIALWAHNDSASNNDAAAVLSNDGYGDLLKGFGGNAGEDEFRIQNDGTLIIYNGNHTRTIQLDPSESGAADGSQITLYDSDGNVTIEIDGDFNGDGRVTTQELQITGGSDLSEQFDIHSIRDDLVPVPGMVVSIDPENPGDLIVSSQDYDRKVAGIISGAGGVKPGMLMGQRGSKADGINPVALTGRVFCLADASFGAIETGDLLTTSNTPGHAMKVIDHGRASGATLGKAMNSLKEGRGLVLVLVSLQ
jgi:hypothetical protein